MPYSKQVKFLPNHRSSARIWALTFLFLLPLAFGALAIALGQDANWDLRNYHYYNAYAFLNDRYSKDLLPSQIPYFYNPLMDVPFFLMTQTFSAKTCGFILGAIQGLNGVLLFFISYATIVLHKEKMKVLVCAALAVLGMLGGGGTALIGTTFGDNITSLGVFLSAALVIKYWEQITGGKNAVKSILIAATCGIPVGMTVGLKLPCVIFAVGLCFGLLFSGKNRRGFIPSFAFGIGVMIGCAVTLTHWALFLYNEFGSPLFPYFNDIFKSPLQQEVSTRDVKFLPHSIKEFLFMPFIFANNPYRVGEIPWKDLKIPLLYALLPVATFARTMYGRNRYAKDVLSEHYRSRYLLAAFVISYFVWLIMFSIYRYAVPIEMIAPLLLLLTIDLLPIRISTRGMTVAFVIALSVLTVQAGNWSRKEVWLDKFIEAQIPNLPNPSNLMILMAGAEPYSHLIPEFPPEISFVRIQSNFSSPEEGKGINQLLQSRISSHLAKNGQFMLFVPTWQVKDGANAAKFFGLKLSSQKCLDVTDRLFDDVKLSLCPMLPI